MRAGLYVHVPFCLTRCGYCDFNTYAGLDHLAGRYTEALEKEADLAAPEWDRVAFASMFFGGGTPTTLPATRLVKLLYDLRGRFHVEPDAEITVEANPDTVDQGYLGALLEGGVTRLSMGVQSFDHAVLASLERVHSPEAAREAFRAARLAGFTNVSLDLIYGAEGETIDSWRRTLQEAVELGPQHLSCYALTIEPSTALGRRVAAGLTDEPDPDLQAEMYDVACELVGQAAYRHYEVSNWALEGFECVHNRGYWEDRPYLGLGAGAHSHRGHRRWWNVRPPFQYVSLVESGRLPTGGDELLTEEERRMERLLLGLRTAEGVPVPWLDSNKADGLVEEGIAKRRNGRVALTDRGLFLANEAVLELAELP